MFVSRAVTHHPEILLQARFRNFESDRKRPATEMCKVENLMLKALLGVSCAGEILDWKAPTGGHLI